MAPISRHIVNYLVNPVKGEKAEEKIKNAARPKLDESRLRDSTWLAIRSHRRRMVEKKRFELSTPTLRT